jgi:multidrug efflux pump
MIPLASLVKVSEVVVPRELNHFGQRRSASITANLGPELALGDALQIMNTIAAEVLPPGYTTDLNGQSREFRSSSGSLAIVFALALLFIFLVLAAQFESFVDPFIILLSVPLSMLGALAALRLTGGTLNVFSQIGLITLVGLISKHGILIVEFANQLREQGHRCHGAGCLAAGPGLRRGRREPAADRLGHRGRHVGGYVADHLRGADDVHAAGAQSARFARAAAGAPGTVAHRRRAGGQMRCGALRRVRP